MRREEELDRLWRIQVLIVVGTLLALVGAIIAWEAMAQLLSQP